MKSLAKDPFYWTSFAREFGPTYYDALTRGEGTIGLFGRALLFLALALRIGDGKNAGERMKHFRIVCGENDPSQLIKIQFTVDGEERQNITPVQFSRLRPILAAQNGIELVGESENPELIEAQKDLNERNAPKLDFDVQHLIESVSRRGRRAAHLCG